MKIPGLILALTFCLFSCTKTDMESVQFSIANKGTETITKVKVFAFTSPDIKAIYLDSTAAASILPGQTGRLILPTDKLPADGGYELKGEDGKGRKIYHRFGFFGGYKRTLSYNLAVTDTVVTLE